MVGFAVAVFDAWISLANGLRIQWGFTGMISGYVLYNSMLGCESRAKDAEKYFSYQWLSYTWGGTQFHWHIQNTPNINGVLIIDLLKIFGKSEPNIFSQMKTADESHGIRIRKKSSTKAN